MNEVLERYMDAARLPEAKRNLLRRQMEHSVSYYDLNGQHVKTALDKEDLLSVVGGIRRYMVDTNSPWKREASKPENFDKAFIIGQTVADEQVNLKGVFFGKNTDISNNNLFTFGLIAFSGVSCLEISRLDAHFSLTFDHEKLNEESTRANSTNVEFLQREREHMCDVLGLKQDILHRLGFSTFPITQLPPIQDTEPKKARMIDIIRSSAPYSAKNFCNAVEVASFCYAALLLERDDVGSKTRNEFNDSTNRNVFGDTRLVQNALWLNAHMLSSDKAVKRMVDYINLPAITVTDKIVNPFARVLWFRLLKRLGRLLRKF